VCYSIPLTLYTSGSLLCKAPLISEVIPLRFNHSSEAYHPSHRASSDPQLQLVTGQSLLDK
jgi:hypothetical protein